MNLTEISAVVDRCTFPGYKFKVTGDSRGIIYLQATYDDADTRTGALEPQTTRPWLLDSKMSASAIAQTVFKCVLTSHEHYVREWFRYKGMPVYGPHHDVDMLAALCLNERAMEEP